MKAHETDIQLGADISITNGAALAIEMGTGVITLEGNGHTINMGKSSFEVQPDGRTDSGMHFKNVTLLNGGRYGLFGGPSAPVTFENVTTNGEALGHSNKVRFIGKNNFTISQLNGEGQSFLVSSYWSGDNNGYIDVQPGATVDVQATIPLNYSGFWMPHTSRFTIGENASFKFNGGISGDAIIKGEGVPISIDIAKGGTLELNSPSDRPAIKSPSSCNINVANGGTLKATTASTDSVINVGSGPTGGQFNFESGANFDIKNLSASGTAIKHGTLNFHGNDLSVWGVGQASAPTPNAQAAAVSNTVTQSGGVTTSASTTAPNINSYMLANKVSHIKGEGKNLIEGSIAASGNNDPGTEIQQSVASSVAGSLDNQASMLDSVIQSVRASMVSDYR